MASEDVGTEDHGQMAERVSGYLTGALTTNMIYIGDQLGLYAGLRDLRRATSEDLAQHLGLNERWVREWLYQQASAKLIETDKDAQSFWLTKPQENVLANESGPLSSPSFMAGMAQGIASLVPTNPSFISAFKTGKGLTYDEQCSEVGIGIGRHLSVWARHHMIDSFSKIPGLRRKLATGIHVADIGCGCGAALLILGAAFPNSTFHGYDISTHALKIAQKRSQAEGVMNVSFFNSEEEPLPRRGTYEFMYSLDVVHDLAHPDEMLKDVRCALKDGGQYLICDIDCKSTPGENIKEMAGTSAFFYGMSVCVCMSSALSDKDSMGLGTLGLTETLVRRLTAEAGFSKFDKVDFGGQPTANYLVSA